MFVAKQTWARSLHFGTRLDFVFDTLPHERLLFKLQGIGISGNLLSWISSFLNDRSMQVKVNDTFSAPVLMTSKVPQRSVPYFSISSSTTYRPLFRRIAYSTLTAFKRRTDYKLGSI
ncbi:unnamed protein product [Dicrocoelium dendriticum]|nr:unnamed protein product [Dicrocoelium dendriticum]